MPYITLFRVINFTSRCTQASNDKSEPLHKYPSNDWGSLHATIMSCGDFTRDLMRFPNCILQPQVNCLLNKLINNNKKYYLYINIKLLRQSMYSYTNTDIDTKLHNSFIKELGVNILIWNWADQKYKYCCRNMQIHCGHNTNIYLQLLPS